MQTGSPGTKRRGKLRVKLSGVIWLCVLPFILLFAGTISRLYDYSMQYDQLVRNISGANEYSMGFKDDLDECMYRIIIGSANWRDPEKKLKDDDPKAQIQDLRGRFISLGENTTEQGAQEDLDSILSLLDILEERVDEILDNVKEGGHYDENMELLDVNIRTLTTLIQDYIHKYIHDSAVNMESLRREVASSLVSTVRVLILLLLALLGVIFIVSRKVVTDITTPITQLCDMTEKFAAGDFSVSYHSNTNDELETLSESFNSMVGEIKSLVDSIHREQENAREMELRLLQEQINPHFLYNTLDAIIWMTQAGEDKKAIQIIRELSTFFRISLSKGAREIPIRNEKDHVGSYLTIQRFRYQDILDYELDFDEEIYECRIPKITLQPIVENALYHGIKNKRGKGMIKVSGKKEGADIVFTVADNGIGMDEEKLKELRGLISGEIERQDDQNGFGMANVQKRLQMTYGEAYGISVESEYNKGTIVTVRIPVKKYKE